MAVTALGVLVGWMAGAWMGDGVTRMYQDYFRFPFLAYQPDLASFALGALVGFGVAGIGTLTGVRRAVKLAPATAMQPQAPTSYRVNLWERLGPMRFHSQAARMMVRHIFRWPLRAFLTVVGLGFSVAILVSSLFFIDAMDEEIETYFFSTQHQDLSLVFNELRSDDVRMNLKSLPGVLAVETVRDVPARLSFGPRRERVAIQGLKPDADLNRLIDKNHRPVALPPEGLVLSDKMAELLGAKEGDVVHVSALEGRRAEVDVPVVRVVQQYIGYSAYMDRRALNRIMREGNAVSGANLKTDASAAPQLYAALKKTPVLQGLAERAADYTKFRSMIEQNLFTMLTFYVLFASLIAVGVVYNSARIALSERARELASLRVLGFTKREVGIILVGELAILTFFALPLGCVVGYWLAALMSMLFDSKLYRIPLVIDPSTYGVAVVVALVATVISAAIVVRRVANLDLIAVLKTRE
jgi:putative ABC transport system permease protein